MKHALYIIITIITCAANCTAQVIDYVIDPTFNSGLLFNRGAVSDILHTEEDNYMITGMFSQNGNPSPITAGAMITNSGNLFSSQTFGGTKVAAYKNEYLQYGQGIRRFNIPGTINPIFKFEFQKPTYSGPLANRAYDVIVLPDENILVAGRFFTDSTLMGTSIVSQGLRQLCMIDSTGAPVPDFNMLRCSSPVDAEIWSINKLSCGKYIVAGRFAEIEGHSTNSIARLNANFSVDTTFVSPLLNLVLAFVQYIDSQDRVWLFLEYGILLTSPDATVLHARLLADGTVDTFFNSPVLENHVGNSIYNTTFAPVHEDDDGTFILGGDFTHYNDTLRKGLAKIYDNGYLVPQAFTNFGVDDGTWGFWSLHFGPNISVIRPLPDGKLLIGGGFSSFGGEPYSCLVRLQPNGFVGTDEKEGSGKLNIWPNPSSGFIQVALPSSDEPINHMEIIDLQGRTVLSRNLQHSLDSRIDIHNLPSGLYLVRASGGKGMYTQKLIVQ